MFKNRKTLRSLQN